MPQTAFNYRPVFIFYSLITSTISMNTLRLAIAEDHKIFRKGIILSLQPYKHIQFVAEAGNGQELIDQLNGNCKPDVILMDIRMPGIDGIAATKYIKANYPGIHIICLTMFEDRQFVDEMIRSGANAYLPKNAEPSLINSVIGEVMEKGYYDNQYGNGNRS